MKKTTIKAFILLVAIAIAVGGVLFFLLSIVSPPNDVKSDKVHEIDIEHAVSSYSPDSLSLSDAESELDNLYDRASLFFTDSLISEKSFDNAVKKSSNAFAKSFIDWCHFKFGQSSWDSEDHKEMGRIISKLRKMSVAHNTQKAIESQTLSSLTEIENVISDYYTAWGITKQTAFSSLSNATDKINAAKKYATQKYLSNCSNLVSALNEVSSKLEQSHFNYLSRLVNSLSNYRSIDKSQYMTEAQDVQNKIDEYNNNAKRVYGFQHDVSNLTNRAGELYNEAMDYYNNSEIIVKNAPYYTTTSNNKACKITQVQLIQNYTRVTLCDTNYYDNGGTYISPQTYIVDQQGNRHYLIQAEGIPIYPQKHYFSRKYESLTFTLVFDRLPAGTSSFNLIESGDNGWKFYNISIN